MTLELPTADRLHELIDRFGQQRVAMWVDLVADRYISGTPKRISREAPVLILRKESEDLIPGGGANAIANVAALGGKPLPVGFVGDDPAGHELLRVLDERGIPTAGIIQRSNSSTPTKTRILAGGRHAIRQQVVRYDEESQVDPSAREIEQLLSHLSGWKPLEVLVLSDYGYGAVDPKVIPRMREAIAGTKSCRILADSRYRLADFAGTDGATPNAEEAETLIGTSIDDPGFPAATQAARKRLDAEFLLVTSGSTGMSLYSCDTVAHIPVHGTDQVADVTGAGDTVIGTFAVALAAGGSPLEASCLANYAGGIVVMKAGTATASASELHQAVASNTGLLQSIVLETASGGP